MTDDAKIHIKNKPRLQTICELAGMDYFVHIGLKKGKQELNLPKDYSMNLYDHYFITVFTGDETKITRYDRYIEYYDATQELELQKKKYVGHGSELITDRS